MKDTTIKHNDLFEELQQKLYKTKNKEEKNNVLTEMYKLLIDYYENLLAAYAKQRALNFKKSVIKG